MSTSTSPILMSIVHDIYNKQMNPNDDLDVNEINLLKRFGLYKEQGEFREAYSTLKRKETTLPGGYMYFANSKTHYVSKEDGQDMLVNIHKVASSSTGDAGKGTVQSSSPPVDTPQPHKVGETKVTSLSEFKSKLSQSSYTIDAKLIESHLAKFLESVTSEDEGYLSGEIQIWYFKELNSDVNMLVGAGTKILDALLFAALRESESSNGMFTVKEIASLSSAIITKNMIDAKRSIQAAAICVYIQGSLPRTSGDEQKTVPKFIKENLYKGEVANMSVIAKQLSSASTSKFPAKTFLNIDINKFTDAVATRCKLGIAGNKAVRYALYASSCEKREVVDITDSMKGPEIATITEINARIKQAREISEFLKSLNGNVVAQLRMHPLAPNRPVVKNLLLKLTRAIIESLSKGGRLELYAKVENAKNAAFLIDSNFIGTDMSGVRTWTILENSEADFSDISVASLKAMYGVL